VVGSAEISKEQKLRASIATIGSSISHSLKIRITTAILRIAFHLQFIAIGADPETPKGTWLVTHVDNYK